MTALVAAIATAMAALATAATSWLVRALLPLLEGRALALPTERSSHSRPTPCGGGVAIVALVVPAMVVVGQIDASVPWTTCAFAAAILAWCSWIDDRGGVAPAVRLVLQVVAVALVLAQLDGPTLVGLPPWADALVVGLAWVWFTNLYNFMDGIDGLAGIETVSIGAGIVAVATFAGGAPLGLVVVPAVAAGASVGFLRWNWSPARVFLGDVGSIPLGFVLGFALIVLWREGHAIAALVLPALFVVDATWTLVRRVAAGHRPWHAHREHAYQRAVVGGSAHAVVSAEAARTNAALVVCSIAAAPLGPVALVAGVVTAVARVATWRGRGMGGAR